MKVEIKEGLKNRLFMSIVNELEYMINETSEPKEYQLEINAFIDFMLGVSPESVDYYFDIEIKSENGTITNLITSN